MGAELLIATLDLDPLAWVRAASAPSVLDVTIIVPSVNSAQWISVRIDGGPAQPYPRNTVVTLRGVDLSRIEFQGFTDNRVTIVAQSRPVGG